MLVLDCGYCHYPRVSVLLAQNRDIVSTGVHGRRSGRLLFHIADHRITGITPYHVGRGSGGSTRSSEQYYMWFRGMDHVMHPARTLLYAEVSPLCLGHEMGFWHEFYQVRWQNDMSIVHFPKSSHYVNNYRKRCQLMFETFYHPFHTLALSRTA